MEQSQHPQPKESSSWEILDSMLPISECNDPNLTRSMVPSSDSLTKTMVMEKNFGRYAASELLGEGGYGRVYKAFDEQLERHVAVKVPHIYRLSSRDAVKRYLEEARTVAKLEHPGVVAVHDVGVTEAGLPFIVSAYIDGTSLATQMHQSPLTLRSGLRLLAKIGDALQYVHSQDIVHRDIKPGNILLNQDGKPFLADFGLALRDEVTESRGSRVGTPAYMSPEQARGESHLVDGRSDIFSLGVVLYEMLTGKRPFRGNDRDSIVQSLLTQEPRPPRQINATLPRDLERICLKALAKRAPQRYSSASGFVDDIQHFLALCEGESQFTTDKLDTDAAALSTRVLSESSLVVPRGLQSYDRHDASFFNRLIPGPRDREWVPESLRFWQRQIENTDTNDPPRVGVLYGPSGCGKSSFVKAGLLPLLGDSMTTVFVEATGDDTESRLLRGIRRRCPDTLPNATLSQTLSQIRQQYDSTGGRRLLIVIDQFEQWLHGRSDGVDPELANALRQCDGYTVQCLLLVRDDFWLALSRFMAVLDIPLKQNHNAALVDLFSTSHARRVIAELGVAYDCLPKNPQKLSADQESFVSQAAQQLSDGGKVFPVRLTLFVEMVKLQPWTPATLANIGGVAGIGLQFLEESFTSDLAPIAQRTHEPAVRQVLRRLLPDRGVDIKGNMQSEQTLLETSGYQDRPAAFAEMMRVLDTDLRLVIPTDPSGTTTSDDSYSQSGDGVRYYQLTHDYLVPAIEEWLTRRQRETRRGRAELRLAEYASVWSGKPVNKYLPSWISWASIRLWSSPRHWNNSERKMMRQATKCHLIRTAIVCLLACTVFFAASFLRQRSHAAALVKQLQTARTVDLPEILEQIGRQKASFVTSLLSENLRVSEPGGRPSLLNHLGLLQNDEDQKRVLLSEALDADLPITLLIRDETQPHGKADSQRLLAVLTNADESPQRRLHAAVLLGQSLGKPVEPQTNGVLNTVPNEALNSQLLVDQMIQHIKISPQDHSVLVEGVRPFSHRLVAALRSIVSHPDDSQRRSIATSLLIPCLENEPAELLDTFLQVEAVQHEAILPTLDPLFPKLLPNVRQIAFADLDPDLPDPQYDAAARRKGTAAALLHRLGHAEATWLLMSQSPLPNARSYLVHAIGRLGGDFELVLGRFSRETRPSIRRALLITLGQFRWNTIADSLKLQAIAAVKDAFENDPDVGIHSAAEWALRRWDQSRWLKETISASAKLSPDPRKNWYVTAEGHTMAVFDARSVPIIGRVFAICTKEISVAQFLRFDPDHEYYEYRSPTPDCPVGLLNWFRCLDYCRWLSEKLDASPNDSYPVELTSDNSDVNYSDVVDKGAYRLPTDAEWRYACAAMTTTRRYFGWSDSLASHYYWYWYYDISQNAEGKARYYPAATKEPNDFGMFSMYDNVREWGHDNKDDRRSVFGNSSSMETNQAETITDPQPADLPAATNGFYGLRIARTIVNDS